MDRRRFLESALSILAATFLLSRAATHAADAPSLDDLRKAGVVGERYDGLVVLHTDNADSAVRSLVESVNAQRREIYEKGAKKQGVSPAEVGKVYALELVQKAPRGTWFLGDDGKWVQKK